jgi:hypothetical protein
MAHLPAPSTGLARHSTSCPDGDGLYRVSELDAAAFPTDDPEFDAVPAADAKTGTPRGAPSAPTMSADGVPQIDVMVVWTPAARNAVGGTQAAIESLVQSAVANANLAYTNSGDQRAPAAGSFRGSLVHRDEHPIGSDLARDGGRRSCSTACRRYATSTARTSSR